MLYFQQVPAVQNGFILLWNLWWHAAEDAFGQSPSEFILCYISYKWMHYFWTAIFSPSLWFDSRLVLEQTLNSSLPFEQVGLKFCLAWASLRLLFLMKLADDLPRPLCPSDKWEWRVTCSAGKSTCDQVTSLAVLHLTSLMTFFHFSLLSLKKANLFHHQAI